MLELGCLRVAPGWFEQFFDGALKEKAPANVTFHNLMDALVKGVAEQKQRISVTGNERDLTTFGGMVHGSLTRGLTTWAKNEFGEDE